MDHLRSHPVGVSHNSVPLPAVRLLQTRQFTLGQLLLVLVVNHEPGQAEVCHHHCVVLHKEIKHVKESYCYAIIAHATCYCNRVTRDNVKLPIVEKLQT